MATKDPRLIKIEEDFEKIERVINLETTKKTSRIESILENLVLYSINAYSACIRMYKLYGLKEDRYPDIEIIARLKQKIHHCSPRARSLMTSSNLFKN